MRIDIRDASFKTLTKDEYGAVNLPLFSQFFSFLRKSYSYSIQETAAFLKVAPEIIIGLEKGQIWGNVNRINLALAENLFNLRKGCLKKILRQTLIIID